METIRRIPDDIEQRLPHIGKPLPDLPLVDAVGVETRLSSFRQRQPVLLALTHGPECAACKAWLHALAGKCTAFEEQRAAVLIVIPGTRDLAREAQRTLDLPLRVLADEAGMATALFVPPSGAASARPAVALYAADRYGYCLARWLAAEASGLPAPEATLVPIRDAEQEDCGCGLPAWPVEEEL